MKPSLGHGTRSSADGSSFRSEVDTDMEDSGESRSEVDTALSDKYGGGAIEDDLNIQNTLNSVQYDASKNGGTESETEIAINSGIEVTKAKSIQIEEGIMEEEVVELEFEKAVHEVHTHSMYCPNCDHHITEVALRRKIIKRPQPDPITEQPHEPLDLLGCFSWFSWLSSTVAKAKSKQIKVLEFEKAIPKVDTHTMHCPYCDHHITKVVLRRKIIKRPPQPDPITEQPHESLDLFGCFSCFSLFTSTDNGGFNPFPIFGNKTSSSVDPAAGGNDVVYGNINSIIRVYTGETKGSKGS